MLVYAAPQVRFCFSWVEPYQAVNRHNARIIQQRKALAENMKRYGFLIPIITNQDGLIADGQHRWEVAQSLGMTQVPVIKLPIHDVDRRILRQAILAHRKGGS